MTAIPDPHAWLYAQARPGERGPARARALLRGLGDPQQAFAVLRVVGTNGKGSTAAMLEAGLLACGESVGCFTSPHLSRFEERVRIGGRELAPERTADFVAWARARGVQAGFFELALALACREFARAGVRWVVAEAGVGGASDATAALDDRVQAVALTNVAADHLNVLGPGLADVARDKAGAARRGRPLLSTAREEADTVARVARERGAELLTPQEHPALFALPHPPALAGPWQLHNAALAAATLRRLGFGAGVPAALGAVWPARLERFAAQGRTVLLDGAHNPAAAGALVAGLTGVHTLLFGALARKDALPMLAALRPLAREVLLTAPSVAEAAQSAHRELAPALGLKAEDDPARALRRALALTPPGGTLLIAGSLHLAGTLRPLLLAAQE